MKWIATGISAAALIITTVQGVEAASFTVQTVQFPTDPTFTQILGINNAGTIAGFHGAATAQGFTTAHWVHRRPTTFSRLLPGSSPS